MLNYYRALIQYDGTGYAGFQWQKNAPTVQDALNRAIHAVVGGKCTTAGASRTDSGVHARHQVLKLTSERAIDCTTFIPRVHEVLSPQVRFQEIAPCVPTFNPMVDTVSKEYRYYFTNRPIVPEEGRRFVANLANPLDWGLLEACAKATRGTHDFHNFYSTGSNVRSTVRTVLRCEIVPAAFPSSELFRVPADLPPCYEISFEADGFLKQMIRHLVSAFWRVGSGKLSLGDFLEILDGPRLERRLWIPAPACGLHLFRINYRD